MWDGCEGLHGCCLSMPPWIYCTQDAYLLKLNPPKIVKRLTIKLHSKSLKIPGDSKVLINMLPCKGLWASAVVSNTFWVFAQNDNAPWWLWPDYLNIFMQLYTLYVSEKRSLENVSPFSFDGKQIPGFQADLLWSSSLMTTTRSSEHLVPFNVPRVKCLFDGVLRFQNVT